MNIASKAAVAALVLLMLAQPASAQEDPPTLDVREYTVHVHNQEGDSNGIVAPTNFTVDVPHGYVVTQRNSTLVVTVAYMVIGDSLLAQENRYEAHIDDDNTEDCAWNVRTNSGTEQSRFFGIVFYCAVGDIGPGVHNFTVTRTDLIGNGDNVVRASTSAVIKQTETVELIPPEAVLADSEEMFILGSTFPTLGEASSNAVLLFIVLLVISYFQRWFFTAIASVIGILEVFLLADPFGANGFVFTFLLLVIAIVLEIFVSIRDENMPEDV